MNRKENALLKPVKEIQKLERGTANVVIDENPKIAFVRWKDKKVVTLISSKYGLNLLQKQNGTSRRKNFGSILNKLNASKNTTKEWLELIVTIRTWPPI